MKTSSRETQIEKSNENTRDLKELLKDTITFAISHAYYSKKILTKNDFLERKYFGVDFLVMKQSPIEYKQGKLSCKWYLYI